MVVPGTAILYGARAFVISEAETVFPLDEVIVNESLEDAEPPKIDDMLVFEDSLKSKLRVNTQMVTPTQGLADALRIDLEYVGLEIIRIEAEVLSWTGRKLDQPKSAKVALYLDASDQFEEDLILASLVVAKYAVRYFLDMDSFDLYLKIDDGYMKKVIPTERARFLLIQPGSLADFINTLAY